MSASRFGLRLASYARRQHTELLTSRLLQHLNRPLVQTLTGSDGGAGNCFVIFRRNAQNELAGIGFKRLNAVFLAGIHKYFKRNRPFAPQAFSIGGIKISASVKPDKLATKQINILIVSNDGLYAVNGHLINHGVILLSVSRASWRLRLYRS